MDALDKELSPVLERLMTLPPGNDDHPDVQWLYTWLIHHERSVEDFIYILGPLQTRIIQITTTQMRPLNGRNTGDNDNNNSYNACKIFSDWSCDSERDVASPPHNPVYLARIASEALAVCSSVLEGQSEAVIGQLFELFQSYSYHTIVAIYGPASTKFSNWLINIGNDSYVCLSPVMWLKVLPFYMLLKVDEGNFEQALSSFMFACSFLDRHHVCQGHNATCFRVRHEELCIRKLWKTILSCFNIFRDVKNEDYLIQFDKRLKAKIRLHKKTREKIRLRDISHEYAIGLKTLSQPREVQSLTVLLKSASEDAHINYKVLFGVEDAFQNLFYILCYFKRTLKEPELRSVTAETIMDFLEALVLVTEVQTMPLDEPPEGMRDALFKFMYIIWSSNLTMFYPLLQNFTNGRFLGKTPIGQEIIRRYTGRISKMRSQIGEKVRDTLKTNAPMIYDIIFNNEY